MLPGSANAAPNRTRPLSNTVRTPTAKDCLGNFTISLWSNFYFTLVSLWFHSDLILVKGKPRARGKRESL